MIVVTASFVTMWISGLIGIADLSPISAIIPSAFGELALHTGFIIWKAKNENMRKFNGVNRLTPESEEL